MSKINFRSLKLKSHEEYLIYNIFCLVKGLIFQLNRKVKKGERNDKIPRESKSKAILSYQNLQNKSLCTTLLKKFSHGGLLKKDPKIRYY